MSYNGAGTFQINSTGQPVVAGTTITATAFNALTADLATGLTTAMCRDGQSAATGNLPMGGFKLTGLAAGTVATDSARLGQVQGGATSLLSVAGTDTITASGSPTVTAYAAGQMFWFVAAGTNTGAATLNIDGLGAKSITRGTSALTAGQIVINSIVLLVYDGTQFQLLSIYGSMSLQNANNVAITGGSIAGITDLAIADGGTGASTASAARTNLGLGTIATQDSNNVAITGGSVTVSALNVAAPFGLIDIQSTTGTNTSYVRWQNSGGTNYIGTDNSTGSNFGAGAYGYAVFNAANSDMVFFNNSTARMKLTSAGVLQFNSGYGSVATAYGCRAWVNFNGTGTVAIRGSGNVSSITDNDTGDYTVNFANAMPDANYSVVLGGDNINTVGNAVLNTIGTYAAGSIRVLLTDYSNVARDDDVINVVVFR